MTEGHPPQQYAYHQGRPSPQMVGRQNQLSAELPMDTQGQRFYSQHPATQPSIPGLTSIQGSAPANNASTESDVPASPVPAHSAGGIPRAFSVTPPWRRPANNSFTESDVPTSPVPADSASGIPRAFSVTPPWRRPH